jgi:hypothetical protein
MELIFIECYCDFRSGIQNVTKSCHMKLIIDYNFSETDLESHEKVKHKSVKKY